MYLESILDSTTLWFDTPILNLTRNNHFNGLRFCGFYFIEFIKILIDRFLSANLKKKYGVISRIFNNFYGSIISYQIINKGIWIIYKIVKVLRSAFFQLEKYCPAMIPHQWIFVIRLDNIFPIEKMLNAGYFCQEWFTGDLNDSEFTSPWYQLQSFFASSMLLEALGLG